MNAVEILLADSDQDRAAAFEVMVQLRPDLRRDDFVQRVCHQERRGYRLTLLRDAGAVRAVAGFRIEDRLLGRTLYVDDLVTDGNHRSRGYGAALLDWLRRRAVDAGCARLELDSGVHRFDAHRFYHAQGMVIRSHHFAIELHDGRDG